MEFLYSIDLTQPAAQFGALVGICGAIIYLYRKILRPVHLIVKASAKLVDYQLQNNGGGSLTDKVDRIHSELPVLRSSIQDIRKSLDELTSCIRSKDGTSA